MNRQASESFRQHVIAYLADGWGVDDIALMRGYDVEAVRAEVAILREMGALGDMFSPVNDQSRPGGRP